MKTPRLTPSALSEQHPAHGVVQGRLRESFGSTVSIVAASLMFGSLHLFNYTGTISEIIAGSAVIVCVSLVFGTLYEVSGSLLIPAIIHGLYNAFLMIASYLMI
ncbi:lysostaphin resistance A-like protein [Natrinema sp. H-ect4]|uniref:CPBP family intramembrane glutamic endopeptidase n=1 Tax=Natrinema sp. H-ect4 TaxID=3242699 RepID=UPI0035A818DF